MAAGSTQVGATTGDIYGAYQFVAPILREVGCGLDHLHEIPRNLIRVEGEHTLRPDMLVLLGIGFPGKPLLPVFAIHHVVGRRFAFTALTSALLPVWAMEKVSRVCIFSLLNLASLILPISTGGPPSGGH